MAASLTLSQITSVDLEERLFLERAGFNVGSSRTGPERLIRRCLLTRAKRPLGCTSGLPSLTRFGNAPRRWQVVRMLEAGAIRLLLGEDRKESCSGQNTSIVGKRGSAVMQSQR
jgi:hypothetical protein